MTELTLVILHPHFLKFGGATNVVLEQVSGLEKRGFKCVVITTKISSEVVKPYPNIKFIQLSNITTGNLLFWIFFPIFYWRMKRELDKIPNRIVYCHSLSIYWGAAYKYFNPDAVTINYIHDLGMPYTDSDLEISGLSLLPKMIALTTRGGFSIINKWIIRTADFFVANSQTSAKYIEGKYHRRVDLVVSPGIDIDIFKPLSKKENYIFTVGRLEKIKNIETIIRAYAIFAKNYPHKHRLVIVGEGRENNYLVRLAKNLGVAEKVDFRGRLTPKDIAIVAARAKIGVFMCPSESFGMAAAESLACGTPVIGINTCGISEVVGEVGGTLVHNNARDVAEAINKLLNNSELLGKLAESGAIYAHKNYSWDNKVDTLYSWFIDTVISQ